MKANSENSDYSSKIQACCIGLVKMIHSLGFMIPNLKKFLFVIRSSNDTGIGKHLDVDYYIEQSEAFLKIGHATLLSDRLNNLERAEEQRKKIIEALLKADGRMDFTDDQFEYIVIFNPAPSDTDSVSLYKLVQGCPN